MNDSAHEPAGYADAITELDALLTELDREELDVDQLAQKVERAAVLIRFCRRRIETARVQVEKVVSEFDAAPTPEAQDE